MREYIKIIACGIAIYLGVVLLSLLAALPCVYFKGMAKSEWLKHQGIEIPWHQAAFLHVEINQQNVKVEK